MKVLAALLFQAVLLVLPVSAQEFARDIEPIFHRKCFGCHGSAQQMNGLRLDDRAAALKGGYSGAAIVPGSSGSSKLIERVTSEKSGVRMPPAGPALSAAEVKALRSWIDAGAEWPESATPPKPVKAGAGRPKPWSFAPLHASDLPNIDAFILARLQGENIKPSPEADKPTLLRRVSLDLTGLPPTPAELDGFLADSSPRAYEHAVDRLLASPHYGERWARQWLDLARYADSDGYEKDLPRPWAWRWRQWVIDSLNADMPFDRFTTLQLAGDLLPDASAEDRVATGFHRNTLRNREGGVKLEQTFFEETVDRTNTVGTVWLGLTVGCAQCHDHKYDPISQKDYYSLYAFFDNIEEEFIDAPMPGELEPYRSKRDEYLSKRQALLEEYGIPRLMPPWEEKVRWAAKNVGKLPDWDISYDVIFQMSDGGHKFIWIDRDERTWRQQQILEDYFIEWYHFVVSKEEWKQLRFKELQKKLRALYESYPQLSQAPVIADNPQPHVTNLRVRGDYARLGIELPATGLASLPPMKANANRLELARWLTSPDNPLPARVAVNRMWQEFFGRGLVRTSEDFGFQGEKPSHPELLDWLAADFVKGGWRIKRMHKQIVMSATYRQQSTVRPELLDRDPDNSLLARQNRLRLPAEAIRDSALLVAGLLTEKVGGRSVYPPQPKGVMELTYAWDTDRWKESEGADRYRRGLYTFFQRTAPYPQMINFDAPDSNVPVSRRSRSNTPLQALNLLNDPVFLEAANAFAARIQKEGETEPVAYAFKAALSRLPDERERQILTGKPGLLVARALLNSDEFITRE
jgi:mono/diheme cytochrome c family protein